MKTCARLHPPAARCSIFARAPTKPALASPTGTAPRSSARPTHPQHEWRLYSSPFPSFPFLISTRRQPPAVSHRYEENGALAFRVGREETDHVYVVKRESGGAQPLRIGPQIQPPA